MLKPIAIIALVAAAAAALAVTDRQSAAPHLVVAVLTGHPVAHDGDDLRFGDVRVRLRGIAAPEDRRGSHEPGGAEARAVLQGLVGGRSVRCLLDGSTAGWGRPATTCYAGSIEINAAMVRAGAARDCPAYSGGAYAGAEAEARAQGRDLSAIYPLPDYC